MALRKCNHKRADTAEGRLGCTEDLWTGKADLVCVLGTSLPRFCSLQLCNVAVHADVGPTDVCGCGQPVKYENNSAGRLLPVKRPLQIPHLNANKPIHQSSNALPWKTS